MCTGVKRLPANAAYEAISDMVYADAFTACAYLAAERMTFITPR
jgi:hypothetical protein